MKHYLALALMSTMAISSANAGDKKVETVTPGESSATEEVGKAVPEMKSDKKPSKESTAPDSATYTDKVGEAVPDMKAPKKD